MIAGHFGFAAAVKSREPEVPLWGLMLATQWLDVLFVPLVVAGIEGFTPVPGMSEGYGRVIIHADYTHSLLGALVIAALYGGAFAVRRGKRVGVVLGAVVFSHWLLDLLMHRADMPLLPGGAGNFPRLGFGLWRLPALAGIVELVLVVVGSGLYWRAATRTAPPDRTKRAHLVGALSLASGIVVLGLNLLGY
jgi:membrane-bound metal-dependent hydrolase YbcI (DUF457 family)